MQHFNPWTGLKIDLLKISASSTEFRYPDPTSKSLNLLKKSGNAKIPAIFAINAEKVQKEQASQNKALMLVGALEEEHNCAFLTPAFNQLTKKYRRQWVVRAKIILNTSSIYCNRREIC